MIEKDNYEVKIISSSRMKLKGYFVPQKTKRCVVAFAGFAGNCDKLFTTIMGYCEENDIAFLFGNTRGSYEIKELKQVLDNGDNQLVMAGACYEDFDETIADMNDWLDFAIEQGYSEICLVGASLACNKIVKLLNQDKCDYVTRVVLLCPQDIRAQVDNNMLSEAKEFLNCGKDREILSDKFFGCFQVSAKTYFDLMTRGDINNLSYLSVDVNFDYLKRINKPMLAIIGSEDQGLYGKADAIECMQKLKDVNDLLEYAVIEGAKHNFKHYEDDVAKLIICNLKV